MEENDDLYGNSQNDLYGDDNSAFPNTQNSNAEELAHSRRNRTSAEFAKMGDFLTFSLPVFAAGGLAMNPVGAPVGVAFFQAAPAMQAPEIAEDIESAPSPRMGLKRDSKESD